MNFFEKFLKLLDGRMTTPKLYGAFHLVSLLVMVGITILLCYFILKYKDNRSKQLQIVRWSVFTYAVTTILFEVYKQLNFSYNVATDTWDYQFYAFPFQFCSTPMYIALIAGSLNINNKFQDYLYSYLCTFSLFAGLAVMFYPDSVFTSTIGINIQTMYCHGGMVVMGVIILVSKAVNVKSYKTLLKAIPVFASLATLALIFNVIHHASKNPETFNMFFISPYFDCTLPLLNVIYPKVPYVVFLLLYLLGFSTCATIVFSVTFLIFFIIKKVTEKIKLNNSNKREIVIDGLGGVSEDITTSSTTETSESTTDTTETTSSLIDTDETSK